MAKQQQMKKSEFCKMGKQKAVVAKNAADEPPLPPPNQPPSDAPKLRDMAS